MRRVAILILTTAWLSSPSVATAQEKDPIRQALDQARGDRDKKLKAATEKLAKEIEVQVKKAADKSDLPGLKRLEAEKEAFAKEGRLPSDVMLAKARVAYEGEVHAAGVELRKALEKAKADYTKARKIVEAEGIDAELVASAPKAVRTVKKEPPFDPIAGQWEIAIGERQFESDNVKHINVRLDRGGGTNIAGMFWRKTAEGQYTLVLPRGGTAKVRLGRKGEQFEGQMSDGKRVHGNRKI